MPRYTTNFPPEIWDALDEIGMIVKVASSATQMTRGVDLEMALQTIEGYIKRARVALPQSPNTSTMLTESSGPR